MPNYVYKCEECSTKHQGSRTIANRNDAPPCPACSGRSHKIITPVSFNFAEGDRPESSRSDSYWDNAERERKRKKKESGEKVMEQSYYNDPKCPEKYKDLKHYADKNDKKLIRE